MVQSGQREKWSKAIGLEKLGMVPMGKSRCVMDKFFWEQVSCRYVEMKRWCAKEYPLVCMRAKSKLVYGAQKKITTGGDCPRLSILGAARCVLPTADGSLSAPIFSCLGTA